MRAPSSGKELTREITIDLCANRAKNKAVCLAKKQRFQRCHTRATNQEMTALGFGRAAGNHLPKASHPVWTGFRKPGLGLYHILAKSNYSQGGWLAGPTNLDIGTDLLEAKASACPTHAM